MAIIEKRQPETTMTAAIAGAGFAQYYSQMTTIRIRGICRLALLAVLLGAIPSWAAAAESVAASVPQTWQMLDYLATDYAGAVQGGAVISTSEYAEMREFATTARGR